MEFRANLLKLSDLWVYLLLLTIWHCSYILHQTVACIFHGSPGSGIRLKEKLSKLLSASKNWFLNSPKRQDFLSFQYLEFRTFFLWCFNEMHIKKGVGTTMYLWSYCRPSKRRWPLLCCDLRETVVACLQQPLLNARRTAALAIKSGLPFSLGLLESGDSVVINWRLVFCVLFDDLAEERSQWSDRNRLRLDRCSSVPCVSAVWVMCLHKWLLNSVLSYQVTLLKAPQVCDCDKALVGFCPA